MPVAVADETSHRQAAEAFYSVAEVNDPEQMAKAVTEMISQVQPGLQQHRHILRQFAHEIISSKKYVDARIKVYQDFLSEKELLTLTELFRNPVFQKYLGLRLQIVQRNAEETIQLFKDEIFELMRRIKESTKSSDPADS
ncbi:MAG TPA: hypothetical protein VIT83_05095 [Gammaproteobacteria bacterium]